MKRALVVGVSGGIGSALADKLRSDGFEVTGLSRSKDGLDITNPDSITAAFSRLSDPFDMIIVATGALVIDGHEPEKSISAITAEALTAQFQTNAMGPMMVLQQCLNLMPKDRRCVFAALSARVGSIGDNAIGGWYSYRCAKAALNQLIHTAAIELTRTHKQAICVTLHPGTVATDFTAKYAGRHKTVPPDEAAGNLVQVLNGLEQSDTGGFFDYSGARVVW